MRLQIQQTLGTEPMDWDLGAAARSPERINVVVCGQDRNDIPEHWSVLAEAGFVNRSTVAAVGFCRDPVRNELLVSLPKAFLNPSGLTRLSIDRAFRKAEVYRLIRLFEQVRRTNRFSIESHEHSVTNYTTASPTDPVLDSLEAALSLRRDFRRNGLYQKKRHRRVANAWEHPVLWNETLEAAVPLLSEREAFFPNTIHAKRTRDSQDPLRLMQVYCLREIFELTGERSWLEDVESLSSRDAAKLVANPSARMRKIGYGVFDDRGRLLKRLIEGYLGIYRLGQADRLEAERVLAFSTSFELIWEHVLREVFGRDGGLPLEKGEWITSPTSKQDGKAPRVDLWLEREETKIIIDAKDYRIIAGDAMLGSAGDHYKQIIYRRLIPDAPAKAANILAFPAYEQGALLRLRGCHRWGSIEESEVYEVTVDYDLVMAHWMNERRLDVHSEMGQIMKEIEELRPTIT